VASLAHHFIARYGSNFSFLELLIPSLCFVNPYFFRILINGRIKLLKVPGVRVSTANGLNASLAAWLP